MKNDFVVINYPIEKLKCNFTRNYLFVRLSHIITQIIMWIKRKNFYYVNVGLLFHFTQWQKQKMLFIGKYTRH